MSQMKEAFGKRLKQLRKDLGYTQQELAYALGIQWSRYHKYELGTVWPAPRREPAPAAELCRSDDS